MNHNSVLKLHSEVVCAPFDLWLARIAGGEIEREVHFYVGYRYCRLAEHYERLGWTKTAKRFRLQAEHHLRLSGWNDTPPAVAVAMEVPVHQLLLRPLVGVSVKPRPTMPREGSICGRLPSNPRLKTDIENARLKGSLCSARLSRMVLCCVTRSSTKEQKHCRPGHGGEMQKLSPVLFEIMNGINPFHIYGPPGTETLVKALMQALTVSSDIRISDGTRVVPIAKMFFGYDKGTGAIYQDANVKVTAAENTHFNFPPGTPAYGKYKSYAYRFETPDRVIVFTGDTGPSAAVTELAKGADMLVSEVASVEEWKERQIKSGRWQLMTPEQQASSIRHQKEEHITPEEIGKMAASADVKTVVLTHLPATADPKDEYKRFGEQVKKHFSGQVLIAKDLMEF